MIPGSPSENAKMQIKAVKLDQGFSDSCEVLSYSRSGCFILRRVIEAIDFFFLVHNTVFRALQTLWHRKKELYVSPVIQLPLPESSFSPTQDILDEPGAFIIACDVFLFLFLFRDFLLLVLVVK